MCNNPNIYLDNMNAYIKFGDFCQLVLKILSGNKILVQLKGHNSVTNEQKILCDIPNIYLVNMNAHIKLGEIRLICSQDIVPNL